MSMSLYEKIVRFFSDAEDTKDEVVEDNGYCVSCKFCREEWISGIQSPSIEYPDMPGSHMYYCTALRGISPVTGKEEVVYERECDRVRDGKPCVSYKYRGSQKS